MGLVKWELCLIQMTMVDPDPHSVRLLENAVILARNDMRENIDIINSDERRIILAIYDYYLLWITRIGYLNKLTS